MTNLTKKELGNEEFKGGHYEKAIELYTEAISDIEDGLKEENVKQEFMKCLNNRAQCYLKLNDFENALNDLNKVLTLNTEDIKALFRRSQAYKGLNRYEDALMDAKRCLSIDPKNKAAIEHMQFLTKYIQDKAIEQKSLKSQSKMMVDLAFTETKEKEKQLTALNNMIVLARENAGADELISLDMHKKLPLLLQTNDNEVVVTIARIFASLCKNSARRSMLVFDAVTKEKLALLICHKQEAISTAASLIIQNMLYSISDLENKRKVKKQINVPFDFSQEQKKYIDEIFRFIIPLIDDHSCSGYGRDNCMDLCLKFVDTAHGCGWTSRFIVFGLPKVLRVAGTLSELPNSLELTEHTKMHAACCMSAVYDDLYSDREREEYIAVCDKYVREHCENEKDTTSKIKAIACTAVLLQGPFDAGNLVIGKNNLIGMMLNMADSNDPLQQRVAVEAVVFSASKKDKATGILSEGFDILKKLYASNNLEIKVRALVGLCKLASSKGTDASIKVLAEGAVLKLEKSCRKFLCNEKSNYDTKKWAADGLAYLTLDADVKEEVANDINALKALFDLTKKDDKNTLYSIATILSNVCNAYEVKKPSDELKELAKYSKHHIPEEHEKDKERFYLARRQKLMEAGVASALVNMSKHKSENCRELISWVFCELCKEPSNRGAIVAAGGGKVLIPMALEGTATGKTKASQALAKISISINPEIAFPGQRCVEVVRPLLGLLHPDKTAFENFESLMALTNLAQVNESVRKRMIKDQGFSSIENYMFDEHPQLRRAATECICNLVQDEDVVRRFAAPNTDRVRLLVLYCGEDDLALNLAASGALAQLTTDNKEICKKVVEVQSFVPIFKEAACVNSIEFQYRIFYILNNITSIDKEMCEPIVHSELMEVIAAVSKLEVEKEREKVKTLANEIMKRCLEHGLIKPTMGAFSTNIIAEEDEDDAEEIAAELAKLKKASEEKAKTTETPSTENSQ